MLKVSTKIGKTLFELEETATAGIVKVTRKSAGGDQEFLFPADLLVEYVGKKVPATVFNSIRKALQ